ncbi:MAG: cation:proton antiporter [Zetaproteobacteria bacterium]|nr:cation:proton antiporter [Zetaproteobacteria bacterium]
MFIETIFLSIVLILIFGRILGEIAARLGLPSVVGELSAGVILGPSLLGWVELNDIIQTLSEIGLILLLFEVGLDTEISRLTRRSGKAMIVATGGFIAPFVLGSATAYYLFHLSPLISMFIGGTLTATSIGVTVRVLRDLHRHKSPEAQIVLGASVIDDVMGVILLSILYQFSVSGAINIMEASRVLIFMLLFILLAPLVAKVMAIVIGNFSHQSRIPGLIPTMVISLVLTFAWLAHAIGAPAILGGFTAGLALSRSFFLPFGSSLKFHSNKKFVAHIASNTRPIIQLFTPIFFVVVGLSLNLHEVNWSDQTTLTMAGAFIFIAMLSKFAGAMLLVKESIYQRVAIGIAMIPRAEVGLIFAELGRMFHIFDQQLYAVMIVTIAATTIIPPFMLKFYYKYNGNHLCERECHDEKKMPSASH